MRPGSIDSAHAADQTSTRRHELKLDRGARVWFNAGVGVIRPRLIPRENEPVQIRITDARDTGHRQAYPHGSAVSRSTGSRAEVTNMKQESAYSKALRDPRWQKRRLEAMEAAGWMCRQCGTDTQEMHVHHMLYIKGRKPWEYENRHLLALCADCHKDTESAKRRFEETLSDYATSTGSASDVYDHLAGYLFARYEKSELPSGENAFFRNGFSHGRLCLSAEKAAAKKHTESHHGEAK